MMPKATATAPLPRMIEPPISATITTTLRKQSKNIKQRLTTRESSPTRQQRSDKFSNSTIGGMKSIIPFFLFQKKEKNLYEKDVSTDRRLCADRHFYSQF